MNETGAGWVRAAGLWVIYSRTHVQCTYTRTQCATAGVVIMIVWCSVITTSGPVVVNTIHARIDSNCMAILARIIGWCYEYALGVSPHRATRYIGRVSAMHPFAANLNGFLTRSPHVRVLCEWMLYTSGFSFFSHSHHPSCDVHLCSVPSPPPEHQFARMACLCISAACMSTQRHCLSHVRMPMHYMDKYFLPNDQRPDSSSQCNRLWTCSVFHSVVISLSLCFAHSFTHGTNNIRGVQVLLHGRSLSIIHSLWTKWLDTRLCILYIVARCMHIDIHSH